MTAPIRVTVWNEFWHENPQRHADVKTRLADYGFSGERLINATAGVQSVYPDGMHEVIAESSARARVCRPYGDAG